MVTNVLSTGLLADARPDVIVKLNNGQGTFLFNCNMNQVEVEQDEMTTGKAGTKKMWQYDSLRVEWPMTADNIFSTMLTAKYPANKENKLVNEYQSAVLGLLPESSKQPYEDFLRDRLAIREMVDTECARLNIPNDL